MDLSNKHFKDIDYSNSLFNNVSFEYSVFENCIFYNTTFINVNLNHSIFTNCELILNECKDTTIQNITLYNTKINDTFDDIVKKKLLEKIIYSKKIRIN